MSSLAARLYEAHRRALQDPTSLPAWGNASTEERGAWEASWAEALAIFEEAKRDNAEMDKPPAFTGTANELNAWMAANPGLAAAGEWSDKGPTLAECREKFDSFDGFGAAVPPSQTVPFVFAVAPMLGEPDLHGDIIDAKSFREAAAKLDAEAKGDLVIEPEFKMLCATCGGLPTDDAPPCSTCGRGQSWVGMQPNATPGAWEVAGVRCACGRDHMVPGGREIAVVNASIALRESDAGRNRDPMQSIAQLEAEAPKNEARTSRALAVWRTTVDALIAAHEGGE